MIKILKAAWINFRNQRAYNAKVRETIRELHDLTDKELWDIGITRGEIYDIAHSAETKPAKVEVEDIQINANIKGWV